MTESDPITVTAWDETVSASKIGPGTALTFAIPPDLLYREIYFYVEASIVNPASDFWLQGEVVLTRQGHPKTILPASIGSNTLRLELNKSIVSLFPNSTYDRNAYGQGVTGSAVGGNALALLGTGFVAGYANLVSLSPRSVISAADRFNYVIQNWSRAEVGVSVEVTGFRALGIVVSSSHRLI